MSLLFNMFSKFIKVGSQEIPGLTGKFGLGIQNEAGKGLTEFCQENTLITHLPTSKHSKLLLPFLFSSGSPALSGRKKNPKTQKKIAANVSFPPSIRVDAYKY